MSCWSGGDAAQRDRLGPGAGDPGIAVLPALPLLYVFWIIGRYLAEQHDEYLRLLQVRKALVATGFTLAVATVSGFLEISAGCRTCRSSSCR